MPIVSVYFRDELLFQRLEKLRGDRSRSAFILDLVASKLGEIECKPAESEPAKPEDPFEELHKLEANLKELQEARGNPESKILNDIANRTWRYGRSRYGLDDLPADSKALTDDQKKRFWKVVDQIIQEKIWDIELEIDDHRLDGIRHERCMKLTGIGLKRLRMLHREFVDGHDYRSPTIRELASYAGLTYQKAANIVSLLGRGYGVISEKERRKLEEKEEEAGEEGSTELME